ncbi:MAG: hypothetical protein ABEJ27_01915, partial [Halodesulfurarchaeum sp.]
GAGPPDHAPAARRAASASALAVNRLGRVLRTAPSADAGSGWPGGNRWFLSHPIVLNGTDCASDRQAWDFCQIT